MDHSFNPKKGWMVGDKIDLPNGNHLLAIFVAREGGVWEIHADVLSGKITYLSGSTYGRIAVILPEFSEPILN